jgi:hypothetical protein
MRIDWILHNGLPFLKAINVSESSELLEDRGLK